MTILVEVMLYRSLSGQWLQSTIDQTFLIVRSIYPGISQDANILSTVAIDYYLLS